MLSCGDGRSSAGRARLTVPRGSAGLMRGIRRGTLAGLLLVACHGDESGAEAGARIVVSVADVHALATSEALARIADVQPAADGRVWVLNSIEPYFIVVNADGRVERAFGKAGGGPDEFGGPVRLARGPDGEVWVYDVPRNALRRISAEEPRELRLPSDSFPPTRLVSFEDAGMRPAPPWVQTRDGGFLVGRKGDSAPPTGALGLWDADVVSLRLQEGQVSVEPVAPVADILGDPAARYPGATTLLPYPLWAACEDGSLGLYDPLTNALRRFSANGREGAAIPLDPERREPVTFDGFFTMVYRQFQEQAVGGQLPDSARVRGILEQQFREAESTLADVFPEYADLRCTENGTFWLQRFDVGSGRFGRGPEWIRFDGHGARTTVRFPDAFVVHRIEQDRVWGATVDSLGVPAVAWVRVPG